MQVLLVTDNLAQHEDVMIAYLKAGFQITGTSSARVAETFVRCGAVDLLIIAEKLGGKLTHSTALLAEHHNPMISTILLTDRTGETADEVFELIPSVHSCVGTNVPGALILGLGRTSVESVGLGGMAVSFARHVAPETVTKTAKTPALSMADAA